MPCIDLHTHSLFSDGALAPSELVSRAAAAGMSALALTDHDTVEGLAEAMAAGERLGCMVVPGVEISVTWRGSSLHMLGYWFDPASSGLRDWLAPLQQGREERNRRILERLRELGVEVDEKELVQAAGEGLAGRPHIARLLVAKGVVNDVEGAFVRYLRKGAAAYVARFAYPAEEAIAMLHRLGGIAVLAHPGQLNLDEPGLAALLGSLRASGLDGIEGYHPSHSFRCTRRLLTLARRYDLAISGGSDFHEDHHGASETWPPGRIGCVPGSLLEGLYCRRRSALAHTVAGCC
ncbi:MAG: hypothetical protein BWK76_23540 [Desulfobulbaceae bacterium A2]|nr:MAG: hypothetical protein BWK76_23540 [Desulfobulbaceae bacterium A2]